MNWDDLRIVLAVARERTLSGAAVALGVTHTTVGRRLRALEHDLGVRLFDATPEGFVATAAGQELSELAEGLEPDILLAEGRVRGRDAELRGRLRVTTLDFVFAGFPEAFASFSERYPSVDLTVLVTEERVSLARREADVALRLSDSPGDGLVGRKLGRVAFAAYASSALQARVGPDAKIGDYPWIGWDEREDTREMDAWLAQHAPGAEFCIRIGASAMTLRQAVIAGLGVHFLPCFDGERLPDLRRLGPIDPRFGRDLWLLTLSELRANSRVRAFMDHMSEALAEHGRALAGEQPLVR